MRFLTVAPLLVLAATIVVGPAIAAQHGYLFSIVGRVVSADRSHGTVVLRHGMLETMAPGDETCEVPRETFGAVRPGMIIMATADTRHHPWRLRDVRLFRTRDARPPAVRGAIAMQGETR